MLLEISSEVSPQILSNILEIYSILLLNLFKNHLKHFFFIIIIKILYKETPVFWIFSFKIIQQRLLYNIPTEIPPEIYFVFQYDIKNFPRHFVIELSKNFLKNSYKRFHALFHVIPTETTSLTHSLILSEISCRKILEIVSRYSLYSHRNLNFLAISLYTMSNKFSYNFNLNRFRIYNWDFQRKYTNWKAI